MSSKHTEYEKYAKFTHITNASLTLQSYFLKNHFNDGPFTISSFITWKRVDLKRCKDGLYNNTAFPRRISELKAESFISQSNAWSTYFTLVLFSLMPLALIIHLKYSFQTTIILILLVVSQYSRKIQVKEICCLAVGRWCSIGICLNTALKGGFEEWL